MQTVSTERRSERAATRSGATFLFLDALLDKSDVQAIALTNEAGFVVASTRGRCDASHLANAGLSVLRGETAGEDLGGADVFAHPILLHGAPYALVSMGGRVPRLKDVAASLARILAPRG